jgi:hypothetical protein
MIDSLAAQLPVTQPPNQEITMFTANQIRTATPEAAKEMIKANLAENDAWVVRALKAIGNRQTNDEVSAEHTKHENKVGFSASDGHKLTGFYKQVLKWEKEPVHKYPTPLSWRQMNIARQRLPKYAGQLVAIAQSQPVAN